MKIDITPTIEKATGIDASYMQMNKLKALYFARLADGTEFTVKWTDKTIKYFCPNKTVSVMLADWEQNIIDRHKEALKVLRTGLHPTWTKSVAIVDKYGNKTGKYESVPESIDTHHNRSAWQKTSKELREQLGKIEFVQLILK